MTTFVGIVVGYDGSSPSDTAVDWAAREAARRELPLRIVCAVDLRGAIGFSSFGVLIYYAVANASAFTQDEAHRRWPRTLNAVGLVACVALVAALPWRSDAAGAAVLAAGLAGRAVRLRQSRPTASTLSE